MFSNAKRACCHGLYAAIAASPMLLGSAALAGIDGACCLPDGACEELTQKDCLNDGGLYQGDNTICSAKLCPPVKGACCQDDGMCAVVEEDECDASGGEYQGDHTLCEIGGCPLPPGACCLPDGSCDQLPQDECLDQDGLFQGAGAKCAPQLCPPVGACCLPGGECAILTANGCNAAGGEYVGDQTACYESGLTCATNDDCNQPQPVSNGTTFFSIFGASLDGSGVCAEIDDDVWFTYVPDFTGILGINTCGSNFDTVLSAYDGCACPLPLAPNLIECNDDSCGLQSQIYISVCADKCVLIQVSRFAGFKIESGIPGDFGVLEIEKLPIFSCEEPQIAGGGFGLGNCFTDRGQCLPACNDFDCCNTVCNVNPYCCQITWDQSCVDDALHHCARCGDEKSGDCFEANKTPGCDEFLICQKVCEIDNACCHDAWDAICANHASDLFGGKCGDDGNCFSAHGGSGCEDEECCNAVCAIDPSCCEDKWDNFCVIRATQVCDGAPACPGAGPCDEVHDGPGCKDVDCCEAVCEDDAFCCESDWDQDCVDLAREKCRDGDMEACPGSGDCFDPNDTPGCDDEDCCNAVCAVDDFCCTDVWDDICAEEAGKICGLQSTCEQDPNNDGIVNVGDMGVVIGDWSCKSPLKDCAGDINKDGETNANDMIEVIMHWGPCPE